MPLSENEQRILQDIERSLYKDDPDFVRTVTQSGPHPHAKRDVWLGAVAFIVGLAVLLTLFVAGPVLGFIGFLLMVAGVALIVKNLRYIALAAQGHVHSNADSATRPNSDRTSSLKTRISRIFKR